jgi:DNA-binding LytR/AlgR family response regulator
MHRHHLPSKRTPLSTRMSERYPVCRIETLVLPGRHEGEGMAGDGEADHELLTVKKHKRPEMTRNRPTPNAIFVRMKGQFLRLPLGSIKYIEAKRNYTLVVMADQQLMILNSLRQWQEVLPKEAFCRVHRAFIVALDEVQSFTYKSVSLGDKVLPVGESYARKLMESVVIFAFP